MTDRSYRLVFGAVVLLGLYFDLYPILYGLIGMTAFEGITNLRVPRLVTTLRHGANPWLQETTADFGFMPRFRFEAERAWRLLAAGLLGLSLMLFPDSLWFLPWFMGFAILGAGVSGICPMYLGLRWIGLK
ncbi:MAG TPA: hypothetical protein EYP40_06230 [Chromatiales bacterium]|nr:hypothetical protein [Chromatiales bacterium]